MICIVSAFAVSIENNTNNVNLVWFDYNGKVSQSKQENNSMNQ